MVFCNFYGKTVTVIYGEIFLYFLSHIGYSIGVILQYVQFRFRPIIDKTIEKGDLKIKNQADFFKITT